jgi:hypothetical protein
MSPDFYVSPALVVGVQSNGSVSTATASYGSSNGVRPVINLRSNVTIVLEGTGNPGTATNPYIVK